MTHRVERDPLNVIITGVGGQGNVLASQILGRAAVQCGLKATIGETFGLSQRGGPVLSQIRLSRERVLGPMIPPNRAHIIAGLEPLETLRVLPAFGQEEVVVLVNGRPIHPLNVIAGEVAYPDLGWIRSTLGRASKKLYWLEATEKAMDLGGPIFLNMIMLGALCVLPGFPVQKTQIEDVLRDLLPESKHAGNMRALAIGGEMVRSHEH